MARKWYEVKASADGNAAEVSIYDEIGAWGTSARDFLAALKPFKGNPVALKINSPGGSLFDAIAIYNGLRGHGAPITVQVMGVAASAASLIAMAGDKVQMPENTYLMIHNPLTVAVGNADDMREVADTLDKLGESLVATYSARTGRSADEIKTLLDAETWLTAAEAVEMGFADEMTPAFAATASFDVEHLPENTPAAVRAIFAKAPEAPAPEAPPAEPAASGSPVEDEELPEPVAAQIQVAAEAAGLGDFAATWALRFNEIGPVRNAIAQAREIQVLCRLAKAEDKAAGYIRAGKAPDEVRAALCEALAAHDEQTHTDTARRQPGTSNAPKAEGPKAVTTAGVWAARRNS